MNLSVLEISLTLFVTFFTGGFVLLYIRYRLTFRRFRSKKSLRIQIDSLENELQQSLMENRLISAENDWLRKSFQKKKKK